MIELKPCDYCKDSPYVAHWKFKLLGFSNEMRWQIRCGGCGARGPIFKEKQQAIDAWNKRS